MGGLSEEILAEIRNEAEYYGIGPLVKQLTLCCELNESGCGDVLFYAFLAPPLIPGKHKLLIEIKKKQYGWLNHTFKRLFCIT
jgi:hypothetical protein